MNRKTKKLLLIIAVLSIFVLTLTLFIKNYLDTTKDYKKVLVKERVEEKQKEAIVVEPMEDKVIKQPEEEPKSLKLPDLSTNKENIINVLFLGIDRTDARDKTMGVYRPDTILLASINLKTKSVDAVCIPRDTLVYIPKIDKEDKINHSYVWSGMWKDGIKGTIETVEKFLKHAKIDYYFALDMQPVPKIIDSIGGVEIDVEIDMKTYGANVSKGYQLLDGKKAFDYIHWRYSANGDIDRIKRQQKFIKAILNKLKNEQRVFEALDIVLKYNKYIQTDLTSTQMISLASLYKEIPDENIKFHNIKGQGEYINNISYWISDKESTDREMSSIFETEK